MAQHGPPRAEVWRFAAALVDPDSADVGGAGRHHRSRVARARAQLVDAVTSAMAS